MSTPAPVLVVGIVLDMLGMVDDIDESQLVEVEVIGAELLHTVAVEELVDITTDVLVTVATSDKVEVGEDVTTPAPVLVADEGDMLESHMSQDELVDTAAADEVAQGVVVVTVTQLVVVSPVCIAEVMLSVQDVELEGLDEGMDEGAVLSVHDVDVVDG